jgi:signal transduction histidine kinase
VRTTGAAGGGPRRRTAVNPTSPDVPLGHNGPVPARARVVTLGLVLTGGLSVLALLAGCAATGRWGALVPSVLPAAFLAAGALGARARADQRGVQLLAAVGALHLLAFALSVPVAADPAPRGLAPWLVGVVSAVAFQAGLVAFALLLGGYPDCTFGSPALRRFAAAVLAVGSAVVAATALLLPAVPLALADRSEEVPAPGGLPWAARPVDPGPLVPLLVVAGAVVLVARVRRATDTERLAMRWAAVAAVPVALLLLATPAAAVVVPDAVWAAVFIGTVSTVPFALLAGLVRHRVLEVDLLLTRTLARGSVAVVVLAAYALLSATLAGSRPGLVAASVVLTLVAAVTGAPLLRRAESLADRWATGGRVRRDSLLHHLDDALHAGDPQRLPERVCRSVAEALDVAWVRVRLGAGTAASYGEVRGEPVTRAALETAGRRLGEIECGPRRGGWRRSDLEVLHRVAAQAALSLHGALLSRELEARVEELTSSRRRLVQAEETVRRQVERDLHDGVQQQLVALLARLSLARELLDDDSPAFPAVAGAHEVAAAALRDLRDLVTGIHPALLDDRGLPAAVAARAALLPLPVAVDTDPRLAGVRFSGPVERAAYFVVCEALANVMKHSASPEARVVLAPLGECGLRVAVADRGNGRAGSPGSGLAGLRDRVEALGGRFDVQATRDVGTTVVADFADAGARAVAGA